MTTKFFKSQQKFILKEFGEKAANSANYGWVADRNSYLTKVYAQPGKFPTTIVATSLNDDNKIIHIINQH